MLEGNETLTTEPGTMMYMSNTVDTDVDMDCAAGCGRLCAGENFVKVLLTNKASETAYVGLTPNFPAKVVSLELSELGERMYGKSGAIMSSLQDVNITSEFLAAGGTLLQKDLADNETLVVDSNSLVAFQDTVKLGVRPSGNLCTCCCGGEGCVNTTVTGPGKVIVQSMSFQKWFAAVRPPQQDQNGGSTMDR
jgi:uncharacterized protein (AIM24 family)